MSAGKLDITIEEGSTFLRNITVLTNGGVNSGTPIPLTGTTVRGQIRKSLLDPEDLTTNFICRVVDAEKGVFSFEIPATTTRTLILDAVKGSLYNGTSRETVVGYYDIEIEHTASAFVTRVLQGRVIYSDEVTR